jgi:CheY-like chemotaxis protein
MKFRTVLCEDNDYVREILNFILEERDHEIYSYKDAGNCPLKSISECTCPHTNPCADIIISDVSMPECNGLEFVKNLRVNGCKIDNIALISGYWTEKDILKAIKYDCTVFHKPLNPETLGQWLNKCEENTDPQRTLSDGPFHKGQL